MTESASPEDSASPPSRLRRWGRRIVRVGLAALALAFLVALGAWAGSYFVEVEHARFLRPPDSLTITDRHGVALRHTRPDRFDRRWVELEDVSPELIHALLAAEDARFYSHPGVDVLATLRAVVQTLTPGGNRSGASTITQQTIKLTHGRPHGLWSKPHEILRALALEREMEKEAILEQYLNRLPYGDQIVGVQRASEAYFGVRAVDLGVAEAALLAGIPRAPTATEPRRHLRAALRRRDEVLRRMRRRGFIDDAALEAALASRPRILEDGVRAYRAPRFVDRVESDHFDARVPEHARRPGRVVATSLDWELQRETERIMEAVVGRFGSRGVENGAAVAIDVATGEIRAYVGAARRGADVPGGALDLLRARRQPGSTLKPFVYAMLFESGADAATLLDDTLRGMTGAAGTHFEAENYDGRERGWVRARPALAGSLNLAALDAARQVGAVAIVDRLRALGFEGVGDPEDYGPAIVLGGADVSPLELARAYLALARDGERREFTRYALASEEPAQDETGGAVRGAGANDPTDAGAEVSDATERDYAPPAHPDDPSSADGGAEMADAGESEDARVIERDSARLTSDILRDGAARALAFGRSLEPIAEGPFALKTGTSSAYHDAWAAVYDERFVVVVWLGDPRGAALDRVSGFEAAAPAAARILGAARRRARGRLGGGVGAAESPSEVEVAEADGFELVRVCPLSGALPHAGCRNAVDELFPAGRVPQAMCTHHDSEGHVTLDLRHAQWARSQGWAVEARGTDSDEALAIVHPEADAEWWVDPERPIETRLRANVDGVQWEVDGEALDGAEWLPTAGEHQVVAHRGGESAAVTLQVRVLQRR